MRCVVIRGLAGQLAFSADHPALSHGWHAPERAGNALWRWTMGNGALPIAKEDGPLIIEVTVAETTTYLIDDVQPVGSMAA